MRVLRTCSFFDSPCRVCLMLLVRRDGFLPGCPSSLEHLYCVSFPVSFVAQQSAPFRYFACLFSFRSDSSSSQDSCRPLASRVGQCIKGRVPEEDEAHPPRAAPGSYHLPWDKFSIPTKAEHVPEVGGWDGELVSVKAADGDFRHGATTNATAKTRNA